MPNKRQSNSLKLFLAVLVSINLNFNNNVRAQETYPESIKAYFTDEPIIFDGQLDEAVWKTAKHIKNFTQREPNLGQPASENTEVAIVYDKNNLYVGIWCYQKDASTIVAKYMQRDFNYWSVDNVKIAISSFNDNKNAYLFIVNPLGARADAQIFSPENTNRNWNGVWDVRTQITDKGWFAEIIIPFNTFQFKDSKELIWAINFERNIMANNEEVSWQGWGRDHSINSVSKAGTLHGIKNIGYAKKFEFKPYVLTGFEKNEEDGNIHYPFKTGGDLTVKLSPTLKLNVTTNTDFAQVEADRVAVNLSRFDLYYPEKRDFFLENQDQFSFSCGGRNNLFYTRRIGIENEEVPVNIIAGARLVGKINRHNIGFLSIQTEKHDSIPSTNNTVFRYKADFGNQSYIGGIVTSKINNEISNQVVGLDAKYATSSFLKDKNLSVYGNVARSFTKDKVENNPYAFRVFIDYPNDLLDVFIGVSAIYEDFNPQLGFLQRNNYESLQWNFRYTPRWKNKLGIKQFQIKPWGFSIYRRPDTKEIESFNNETRLLGFVLKSGDQFEFNFKQSYDNLVESFYLIENEVSIPMNDYWMNQFEIQIKTYKARRLWIELAFGWGDFYTGNMKKLNIECGFNFSRHLNLTTNYTYNDLDLPEGNVITTELSSSINYAINPRLNFSLFSQYNSLDEILFFNFKMHWIPNIGSEFYIVYNRGYEKVRTQLDLLKPNISSGVVKISWRFTF